MSLKEDLLKYTPRQEQIDAVDFIFDQIDKDPKKKFFLLNLPTGVGKSHLAMMISDTYKSRINKLAKIDIITAGKILQDQYDEAYESIKNLKGKENYCCSEYSTACSQGKEFNKLNKTTCDSCPYEEAKSGYIGGEIALTNFYLYLIYAIYNDKIIEERDAKVLIVDECHKLDVVISDFISIKITESVIKRLRFNNEYEILKELSEISNIPQYIEFLSYLRSEIIENVQLVGESMMGGRDITVDKRDLKIINITGSGENADVKMMQILSDLNQYILKIDLFLSEYKIYPDNWVLETNYNEKTSQKELSMEPIWANEYLEKYVFSRYDMVILMSGTILNKDLFCQLNGLDSDKAVYYSIESPFPIENRPIYYMPLGKMSFKSKTETFENYIPYIKKILKKYSDKKGIIHTNSFELSKWIENSVDDDRLLFHTSQNKDEVLRAHFDSDRPTVIVSPSMNTGVSFDNDKSRFQIISKVPYPSLASQKNKIRKSNNPEWYSWATCCELLQTYGRSCRSRNDYADTIIIDGSFGDVMKYSSHFIPSWVKSSIKRVNVQQ